MLMRRYDIDAGSSFAYSDHPTDAPMLGCVGNPVAVNPVHKMRRLARVEGWPIIEGTWQGEAEATQGEGAEGRPEGTAKPGGEGGLAELPAPDYEGGETTAEMLKGLAYAISLLIPAATNARL